ncbi:MAG: Mth938-like domain-containing protein [Gammaproteobacteria bacterium]|nr:MAG: Mth938-like domain-containing protein [Gammaproteobacteria bacterium]
MQISEYEFGKIAIENKTYTSDVIISPEQVIDSWRRKRGHNLAIADLDDILKAKPDMLIIGTGYYGRMQVPDETRQYLEEQGIKVWQAKTGDAVAEFNALQKEWARIVAALHLTC